MTALVAASTLMPDTAYAQRGGSRSGGGGRGGAAARPAGQAVGRAVPRGGAPGRPGGAYRPVYRPVYVRPAYWGGFGLGWGWGGAWGGAWGYWGPGWWGPGYASSLWWPGYGWWGGPALYAPPYAMWGLTSDARFLVKPRETEVYVDGALAGIVDQYDGVFQSLTLSPGTHRISLYLDGHRRHDANIYVAPGSTLKLRHTMEALPPGAPPDERPTPPARPQPAPGTAVDAEPGDASAPPPPHSPPPPARAVRESDSRMPRTIPGDAGLLVIRVQPADAEILIDGQRWQTPDVDRPLEVRIPAGTVRIEIRKPGHAPFSTDVAIRPGEVLPLNVSLPSQGMDR